MELSSLHTNARPNGVPERPARKGCIIGAPTKNCRQECSAVSLKRDSSEILQ